VGIAVGLGAGSWVPGLRDRGRAIAFGSGRRVFVPSSETVLGGRTDMTSIPTDRGRQWLCACLFFLAAGCFFIASATSRDPYFLKLAAALLQWIAGFVWLFRLRPARAAQQAAAADARQAARG